MVNVNAGSSLKLGQARGVAMLAAAHAGLPVTEYASKTVKRSVVGTGAAQKRQVAMMVRTLLPGSGEVGADAADALAVALCHAHSRRDPAPAGSGLRRSGKRRMIARLRGRLDSQGADHLVIDVGGVGYLVHCSARTLAALPGAGEALELHIETQVRAESIMLYGFADTGERSWFRVLQQVQGVGARVALGVLSVLPPEELARAVVSQDKAALTRASGVGPRLAGRILSELKDRLAGELAGAALPAQALAGGAIDGAVRRRRLGPGQSRLWPQRGARRDQQSRRRLGEQRHGRGADPRRPAGAGRSLSARSRSAAASAHDSRGGLG